FLSSSLSWAPVAADTLIETSATGVAGPMPQPSSLPIRFSGEVGGLLSAMRGLPPLDAPPPKIPPPPGTGVGCPPAGGSFTPSGVGVAPPPNRPPAPPVGGGTGGVLPPVVGTAEGSIRNTSSSCRPV